MKTQGLSDNHRRVLSVVVRNVERSLDEIEETLTRSGTRRSLLHQIEGSYSDAGRKDILGHVAAIRQRLHQFIEEFQLTGVSFTEHQIIDTKVTHIWLMLADSYSRKLRGYGEVAEPSRTTLDNTISELLGLVKVLQESK